MWLGAWAMERLAGPRIAFTRPREAFAFIAVAAAAAIVSAVPLSAGGSATARAETGSAFVAWTLGLGLGIILATPAVVCILRPARWRGPAAAWAALEIGVFTVLLAGVMAVTFGPAEWHPGIDTRPYVLYPFIIWAGLRFGPTGTALTSAGTFAVALLMTVTGVTSFPLGGTTIALQTAYLEAFFCVFASTGLILAASVAQHRRTEDALRSSESLLHLVNDAVPANIAYVDAGLRYRTVNRSYAAFVGRTPEELVGLTAREALGEEAWAIIGPNLARAVAGEAVTAEFGFPGGGPGGRWVRASYIPDVSDGVVVGVVVMVIDLTDRRRMEADLAERERRYRLLTETMRDVVWVLDPVAMRFTYVSPSVERLRGYTAEEVMDAPATEALLPDDAAALQTLLPSRLDDLRRGIIGEDAYFVDELAQPRKDGTTVWTDIVTSLHLDPETGRIEVYGLSRDISERRRAQEALVRASRMEAVGQLAGGVAHDFNNLLTAIRGFADFLRDDLPADDRHVADVDEIIRAADRAAELTRSLLAYSRRQVLRPQHVRPAALVEDLAPMLRPLVGERIALSLIDTSGGAWVEADPGQVDQVLVNLVVNARHAMPDGGLVTIETSRVHVGPPLGAWPPEAQEGDYVVLTVRDTGVGMDAATRERIFEPFFTTREPGRGSGLGLSTVDGIVRQSGGFIVVDTAPGKGAAFRIHLPEVAAPPAEHEDEPPPAGASSAGTETVLLVEDDDAVRSFASRTLASAGYTVLKAASGDEALAIAAGAGPIDLLLTDLRMPGMQGREVSERLTSSRPDVRVLLMTGFDDVAAESGTAGASDDPDVPLLHKPFGADDLTSAVRRTLDAGR